MQQIAILSLWETLFAVLVTAGYFLPSIIAGLSNHKNKIAIFVLNLLLGWTFLGWLGALVWSVMK